jgi:HSP20 family protein
MVKKIKPVSRVVTIDTEISKIKREPFSRREKSPLWDGAWLPRVDVYEKPTEIIVEAEIPGVSPADIIITVQSSRVEVKGMKREAAASAKIRYLRLEREFGGFRRLVALPATVAPDKAKAFLENGVLTLRLKKYVPHEDKDLVIEVTKPKE